MATCPKGHASESTDYCDECGARMDGQTVTPSAESVLAPPVSSAAPTVVASTGGTCRVCQAPLTGRFCERCGDDSQSPVPTGTRPDDDPPLLPPMPAAPEPEPTPVPAPVGGSSNGWVVVVSADRDYYDRIRALDGPDVDAVDFPAFCPERRFPLPHQQVLIGRRSRSRGIYPDIDLVGPPEDSAVSHTHALLLPQPDGAWAIVDLRSTNRTYLDGSDDPIDSEVPVTLADGARVNVGAWTRLTLHADG